MKPSKLPTALKFQAYDRLRRNLTKTAHNHRLPLKARLTARRLAKKAAASYNAAVATFWTRWSATS